MSIFRDRAALIALREVMRAQADAASRGRLIDDSQAAHEAASAAWEVADHMEAERLSRESDRESDPDGVEDDGTVMRHAPRCECGNFGKFGPTGRDPRCIVPSSEAAGDSDLEIDPDDPALEESLGPIVGVVTDGPLYVTPPTREEMARILSDGARGAATSSDDPEVTRVPTGDEP